MSRGRHRHSPPLHRILAPASVAAAALACAGGAWLFGEPGVGDVETVVLRGLTAVAAAAAVTGAVLLRRWDRAAGKALGESKAKLAGTEWRAEERQAELEGELDEVREARDGMARKVREKRAELARLRTEHADLLRRYAHAEAERAGALEGRRRLELESGAPAKVLTAGATDHRSASGAPTPLTYVQADEALKALLRSGARQRRAREREAARERLVPAPGAGSTASAVVPPRPAPAPPGPAPAPGGALGPRRAVTPAAASPSVPEPVRAPDSGEQPEADRSEEQRRPGPAFDFFGGGSVRRKRGQAPERTAKPAAPEAGTEPEAEAAEPETSPKTADGAQTDRELRTA
ncbi:hypothetical protein [Streptomyces sp. HNM0574]|uniref:hypothetical protein n=1 Tax=Streptomyces sp. HNM0574 TaxID=2714954 RepID=UPI00146F5766|nr:hypothetical protein [Streptomyces sp. HNM0574]NLU67947.1 hypothetical protein [Streptomyces sp. HNM0574]